MKIIHIATLWGANNYGAFLQSYALTKYLEECGFSVKLLSECNVNKVNYLSSIICKIFFYLRFFDNKYRHYKILEKKYKKASMVFTTANLSENCFATVIGSDEVWNVENQHFPHLPLYVGKGTQSERIISYAPSSNRTLAESFIKVYGNDPFKSFSNISVRDESTFKLVKSISPSQIVEKVLDPTFLLDNYDIVAKMPKLNNYLLVYGYSFSDNEILQIKSFAEDNNLRIVSVGVYHMWCDLNVAADPFEFLGLVKCAKYVVTSTFHGTVFSIIFNKQFCSYARNNNKVIEILNEFSLSGRNSTFTGLDSVFKDIIDYTKVNADIQYMRTNSKSYLLRCLDIE